MLNIKCVKQLALAVSFTPAELEALTSDAESHCEELAVFEPAKSQKVRLVLNVTGRLRVFQKHFLSRLLMPRLTPSKAAHGGIVGRSIKTNITPHLKSAFAFTVDISNFFPSVHYCRVYDLFNTKLGCSPDVARICTRLTTYDGHLALGLVTSPFIADQILKPVDRRIEGAAVSARLAYSRFVDDLCMSGPFDLQRSGFISLACRILKESGFRVNAAKTQAGRLDDLAITGLTLRDGHPDVRREFVSELMRQLGDARSLASGGEFCGPFFTRGQIAGRVHFVCWVAPRRRRGLMAAFRTIAWDKMEREAKRRHLVAAKRQIVSKSNFERLGMDAFSQAWRHGCANEAVHP